MRNSIIYLLILFSFIISSCGGGADDTKKLKAVGGKIYGGEFSFMSTEKIESLFPVSVSDVYSHRIISQVFESLLKIDVATMKVIPNIAESFTVSEDARIFTFKIRKGVMFHDDACFGGKGREVNAEDVKFSLDMACSGLALNTISYLLVNKIKGAKEFNLNSKKTLPKGGVSGIKVLDPSTVEIQLSEPFVGFDKLITHNSLGIFSREAYEKYGSEINKHPVGTGAFMLETFNNERIVLKRNPNYWRKDDFGNKLPFLDKVILTYTKDKKSELLAFRNKKIDLVLEIPVEEIENVFGSLEDAQNGKNVKHKVETESNLHMVYMAFACESAEFKDERVRKAFNLAINRQNIVDNILEGEGYPALNGFVPNMVGYSNSKIKGFQYNPALAKTLLADAGYKNGMNFPALEIYVNTKEGSSTHKMYKAIVSDINSTLNIQLKVKLCTIKERNTEILSGRAKLWKGGWVADYPDPENFLCLFYSPNIDEKGGAINNFKFRNTEFDTYFQKALKELNNDKRNEYLAKCDQLVIDHAAAVPILTDDLIIMLNVRVRDFKTNNLQAMDFSTLYIKEQR
jgi:oligopeptide transport system substrate-binding protein